MKKSSACISEAQRITRRQFLAAGTGSVILGASALSIFPRAGHSATPTAQSTLVFGGPGGRTQTILEEKFFPEFTNRYGAKVTYVTGQPNELVAKARLQKNNPFMDVIWLSGALTYQVIDEGLVEEFDPSLVPNYRMTIPALATEKAAVAFGVAVTGLFYNSEVFSTHGFPAPTSWWDMWDPKYRKHVGSYTVAVTSQTAWLVHISQLLTGQYKNLDAAFAKCKELRPNMLEFFSAAGAYETAMQQGNCWLGMNTGTRAKELKGAGMPIAFVQPKEGTAGYPSWMGMIKGAQHPKPAHAWFDYILSTDVQQRMATLIGYTPVNREAKIPAEAKLYFPELNTVFIPDWRFIKSQIPMIIDRWNREIER